MNAKETGSYYTPEFIAHYIVDRTLHAWLKDSTGFNHKKIETIDDLEKKKILDMVRSVRILDPAVGEGVFLCIAADSLFKIRRLLGDSKSSDSVREDIVKGLYGVDIINEAVRKCVENLDNWIGTTESSAEIMNNVKFGNSLIGLIGGSFTSEMPDINFRQLLVSAGLEIQDDELRNLNPFHWDDNFPEIMKGDTKGFDIVIGNPPYGNILSIAEREIISKIYPFCAGGSRNGTWNSAAHFIVRAKMLMREGGHLGFLLPNSILRVGQFTKTRQFLLNEMTLYEIVDEGRPFHDVTLEMVSLFCKAESNQSKHDVKIVTRREDVTTSDRVSYSVFKNSKIFVLYYDEIFQNILKRSERHILTAGRGRDIPAEHVSELKTDLFEIPYASTGRSVQRYRFDRNYIKYTDNWYERDTALSESYSNEFLVATKNLPYPRCVMKPIGILHGGGVVRIKPLDKNMDLAAIGMILNSKLMKYICVRYLTNYSELTTCMNTGIMEEIPIILPQNPRIFARLFKALEKLHTQEKESSRTREIKQYVENVVNALVYSLYLLNEQDLIHTISRTIESCESNHYNEIYKLLSAPEIKLGVKKVLNHPLIVSVENSPRMN